MDEKMMALYNAAVRAKSDRLYNRITYDEAAVIIGAYIEAANERGKKIAKKFNQTYKPITIQSFLR